MLVRVQKEVCEREDRVEEVMMDDERVNVRGWMMEDGISVI